MWAFVDLVAGGGFESGWCHHLFIVFLIFLFGFGSGLGRSIRNIQSTLPLRNISEPIGSRLMLLC